MSIDDPLHLEVNSICQLLIKKVITILITALPSDKKLFLLLNYYYFYYYLLLLNYFNHGPQRFGYSSFKGAVYTAYRKHPQ